jgi:hypothetical protein
MVVGDADDVILGFQYRTDADRFLESLRERLAKFGREAITRFDCRSMTDIAICIAH